VDELRESPLPHPGSAERLHEYWVHGKGAAQIGWGAPGDFDRCVSLLQAHAHFTPDQAKGYCNLAHHAATGMWPAQHAKAMGKRDLPGGFMDEIRAGKKRVTYADPGYQADKVKRYPLDSADHVRGLVLHQHGTPPSTAPSRWQHQGPNPVSGHGIQISDNQRSLQEGDVAVADAERRYTLLPVELRAAGDQEDRRLWPCSTSSQPRRLRRGHHALQQGRRAGPLQPR
jgi:hypothetical protein